MASGDRRTVRLPLLLLLWVVTSSLFSTGLCSGEEFSVCNAGCCNVEPNCSAPLHVICHCQGKPQLQVALRRGDFLASVQSINIYGVRQVVIYEHALLDLTSLANVKLKRINKLTVDPHGLALQKNASLHSFFVDTVEELAIESFAFSGFWERRTRIQMGYISKLYIQQNAFSFQSLSGSPSLIIEEAKFLDMASKAFNAPFKFMSLRSVNTPLCKTNTFSGIVRHIEMRQVNIKEVKKWCINGRGKLHKLLISSCNLGMVHRRGVYGKIDNVEIDNSDITAVQPNGFQLQVGSLHIKRSGFKSLRTRGLNVVAKNSIHFNDSKVHILHRHALIAMQVARNQTDDRTSMVINNLTVLHAEKGSLTFDKVVGLKLNGLYIRAPEHCVCPTRKGVRWLTGTDESEPLTQKDQHILVELNRDWPCQNSHAASSLQMTTDDIVRVTEQPVTVTPSVPGDNDATAEEDKWNFSLLVPPLLFLVLLVMIGCCVKKSNKRSEADLSSFGSSGSRKLKEHTEVSVPDGVTKKGLRKRRGRKN